jgi:predicted CoA-binding protein
MASKQAIDSFLSCRRLAVVGVSRDPKDFSRAVFRAFVERG